jgi:beta-lactamase class A
VICYIAKDLSSGTRLAAHDDVQLPALSTIKVLLAAAFWRMVQAGEADEASVVTIEPIDSVGGSGVLRGFRHAARLSLADLAHLMLAVSDNDATNVIAQIVGLERVNALAEELGLRQTAMRRLMMDTKAVSEGHDNVTSAADLASLMEELAVGDRLGPAVSGPIWASLEKQEHVDGIARYLPAGATYAGKCGDDSPEDLYVHDFALVREGDRRVVMAIMTEAGGGYETVARTAAALYEALTQA